MNVLLSPWWVLLRFWTAPIRAESLAAFRIALAATILAAQFTGLGWQLELCCTGDDPLIPGSTRDEWLARSGRICLLRGPVSLPLLGEWLPDRIFGEHFKQTRRALENWCPPHWAAAWRDWGEQPDNIQLLFRVYLVSLVMVLIGFRTRLMTLVALLLAATFNNRLVELLNGGDSLFRLGLYFLLLSPAGATWSVDAWLRARGKRPALPQPLTRPRWIEPWSVRLMQIQLALMYLFTGLTKLADARPDAQWGWWRPRGDWLDGNALYWVLNDVALTRWSFAQFPVPLFACKLLTWATLFFEIFFPLLVLFGWTRGVTLLFGVALHLGILFTMEIGWFSQVTLCWYLLFVRGEQLSAALDWLRGHRSVSLDLNQTQAGEQGG
ncbi:MAG: HTTM domain-containing protein [Gemmataceae bacterium]